MRSTRRLLAPAVLAGALALSLSACGGSSSSSASKPAAGPSPVAAIATLTGQMTQVTLNPDFLAGLKHLGLTPGVVGSAKLDPSTGVVTFPITGGNATYFTPGSVDPYVTGIIHHDGSGLSLTNGKTTVQLTNFDVDPGKSMLFGDVTANGKLVVAKAPLFFLDGRTLQPLRVEGSTAILEGTQVKVSEAAAGLLNKTYGTTAVPTFAQVGVAKITLALPGK